MAEPREFTFHMIGHGHIDPTWLWRWTEGYEEVRATFRSALERMKETPEFKFTASSACFYQWVKSCDPKLFDEIKARVKEGRWELAGGWWLEPDCNVPCGEAIVRHGLYGQKFFEREFGQRARVGFNPDSFGHSGTFPQILKKLGLEYYVFMRPQAGKEMNFPKGTTFWWQAADGSAVLTCNILDTYLGDTETVDRMLSHCDSPYLNPGQRLILGFYGVGNHGGGPTKECIRLLREADGDSSMPSFVFSTLYDYMEAFLATTPLDEIAVVDTDLQHHARGCYSAHAETKRMNRRAEHALMTAERFAALASLLHNHPYPKAELERAWKDLLYNQFHDILAGTSLESSYADSRDQVGAARHAAHFILNESIQTIARHVDTTPEGNTILVFNPLPWPVRQVVTASPIAGRTLTAPVHIADAQGRVVAHQETQAEYVGAHAYSFLAEVPALGYTSYHVRSGAKTVKIGNAVDAEIIYMENAWWRLELDPYDGHIARLLDKRNKTEVLKRGNVLSALVDHSDTWSHDVVEYRSEAGRFGDARISIFENGPVRTTLRVQSKFRNSLADQFVTLYRESETIDIELRVDWREAFTMLKVAYETNLADAKVTSDTAYGYQERQGGRGEEPCQMWTDLSGTVQGKPYGFAVLNDSNYGFDVRDGILRLSLLRSPAFAYHDPSRYLATSSHEIMDQGKHVFRLQLMPHAGDWRKGDVVRKAWELNEPSIVHVESAHKGKLHAKSSFLEHKAENVVFSVLKMTEDGDDFVLRGYETSGKPANVSLRLASFAKPIGLTFDPHEIKTVCIERKKGFAETVSMLEEQE
ncbi:MAG: hypothetical protein AMXMBFR84_28730 [Candidatus Hydrogenedentota bacterium]